MNVLLLMPRALYIMARFAEACRRQGIDLTIMTVPNPPTKRYLISFVNDTYQNTHEVSVESEDEEAMASWVKQFDAIIPSGEFSVVLAERLSERLGLFHNALERVASYRNKFLMRQAFAEHGVSQPNILARFASMEDVSAFSWAAVRFPVIVKPVDMSASLYVRLCNNADEAKRVYQRIFKHTQSFSGALFSAQGLLEEVALGPEYSVECVIQHQQIIALFQTTKFVSPYPTCDEVGHLSGEHFSGAVKDQVGEVVRRIVHAWGVESAVLHIEYKISDGQVKVIEGACRIGGDMISELVELRYGVSLEECLVLLRCNRDVERAFNRYMPAGDGYYYAIKYFFSENVSMPPPTDVEVLREVRNANASPQPANAYGVERRLGHALVRGRSLTSLRAYLSVGVAAPQLEPVN
jgi:biotin carboxylase